MKAGAVQMRIVCPTILVISLMTWTVLPVAAQEVSPPGKLYEVGDALMHLHCRGSGSPTVVFEAGAGAWSLAWLHVQQVVASETRTCVYDRAGLGWSEPSGLEQTVERSANELRLLLETAGEAPPFVLAAHSYGGYVARVFIDLFPDRVSGLALIESAHEDQWERLPPVIWGMVEGTLPSIKESAEATANRKRSLEDIERHSFFSSDPLLDRAYREEMVDPDHHRTYAGELEGMARTTARVRAAAPLGSLPLIVLSSAREFDIYEGTPIPVEDSNAVWLDLQAELADLSSDVVHIVSRTGEHTIHYQEPGVVAGVVLEVVRRASKN